ncbi:MAG: topoisomerase DNA-binding C4 zinc finger domain-containing protein, partial [Lentisphaerae bacterium]|nr:topoisomerase DNA-binding C4 zinc finger domain-containing protein [Lentisphaerota bacterium]
MPHKRELSYIEKQWIMDEQVGKKELDRPCPECGLKLVLKWSRFGFFYGCRGWPKCDILVGCHPGTTEPLGYPVNTETRQARIRAHDVFDKLWQGKAAFMTRHEAYQWLAEML